MPAVVVVQLVLQVVIMPVDQHSRMMNAANVVVMVLQMVPVTVTAM